MPVLNISPIQVVSTSSEQTLIETALHMLCHAVYAKGALLGTLELTGFRVHSSHQLPLARGHFIAHPEPWLRPKFSDHLETHNLIMLSAWLGKAFENAVGIGIPNSTLAIWCFDTPEPLSRHQQHSLQLAASQIKVMLEFNQETELLRAAQPQHQGKDFGRGIAQSLPIALLVTDLQDRIGFINPALTHMLGYDLETIYMKTLQDIVLASDHQKLETASVAISQSQTIVQPYRTAHSNGTPIWLEISRYPRFDSHQQVIGSVATLREISQEIQTQERLQSFEHDLRNIQKNLQQGSGFAGRLEDIEGAVGLLQMLASNGTDGAITLDDSIIFLEKGRIVATQHPKLADAEAAKAIIQRRRGQFQFFPNVKTERATISLDPIALALEFARQNDETRVQHQQENIIYLPNSKAAYAFMNGISHPDQFMTSVENNQVILRGKGIKIVVQNTSLEEFLRASNQT